MGFPIARLVTITCLATGTVLNYALGTWRGKETGEHALFREIIGCLVQDDLLLADRYYCSYFLIAYLMSEQIDAVFQQHSARKTDFRRGKKLGTKDHLVNWKKPARPDWMDKETYKKNTIRNNGQRNKSKRHCYCIHLIGSQSHKAFRFSSTLHPALVNRG